MITVYTTGPKCGRCNLLKDALQEAGVACREADMTTSESRAAMLVGGCFSLSAPVLQVGEEFYGPEQLFDADGNLLAEKLQLILDGQVPKWKAFAGKGGMASTKPIDCKIWER